MISTVKTSLMQLQMHVSHHLEVGIDEIILFCDFPLDEAVQAYAVTPNVTVVPCSDEYWTEQVGARPVSILDRQIVNVNVGAKIAQEKNCTWITHIDCDELIHPLIDIKQFLGSSRADVIRYSLLEAVPEKIEYSHIFEPTLFRKHPSLWQAWASRALGCSGAFYCGEFLRGHKSSKVIVRLNSKILKHGIHRPDAYEPDAIFSDSDQLVLLHYYCVSFASWREKYESLCIELVDGRIPDGQFSPSRERQFYEYYSASRKGEAELLLVYKKLYFITSRIRLILLWIGMLKVVVPSHRSCTAIDCQEIGSLSR